MGKGRWDDYYAWLGVSAEANAGELRRAWRRLALEWHPDRRGPHTTATFQKIAEAYTVLSDPVLRANYDRRRCGGARSPASPDHATTGHATTGHATPNKDAGPSGPSPTTTPDSSARVRRAPAVLLRRLSGPLNALVQCGVARSRERDVIELMVDRDEASEGGMVSISMPVQVHCPACADGQSASCARCGATGTVEELFSAWLALRPGVLDGTMLAPSSLLPGMVRPVSFRIRHVS